MMKTDNSQETKTSKAWRNFDHFDSEWLRIQELRKQESKLRSVEK